MTVERLYDLYYIKRHIEHIDNKIMQLEESCDIKSPDLSGKPRNPSPTNKLDEIVPKIADLQNERALLALELEEIERWIHSQRHKDQLIIRYRYEERLTWQQVADKLGDGMSAETCAHLHYRCLKINK
ncbi:MAG: hypothetical protein ILA17_06165 [Ruminococcus sp.]|nr:hypothetical protein [Ruminiclostridium sp.]MBP1537434.1 hypothetical protein [Ruminococcus sp.]